MTTFTTTARGKLRCDVCGRCGWPGGKWQRPCLAGHPYHCPHCPARLPDRAGIGQHHRHHHPRHPYNPTPSK